MKIVSNYIFVWVIYNMDNTGKYIYSYKNKLSSLNIMLKRIYDVGYIWCGLSVSRVMPEKARGVL